MLGLDAAAPRTPGARCVASGAWASGAEAPCAHVGGGVDGAAPESGGPVPARVARGVAVVAGR